MKNIKNILSIIAVVVVVGLLCYWGYTKLQGDTTVLKFRAEKITKENVYNTIAASGTVEPEELVNVGAQVNGKIMEFGTDVKGNIMDYGSPVKAGMLLAKIDDLSYKAAFAECKAAKLQGEAAILSAKASIQQAKAKLVLAKRNWERAQELHPKGAMSKSDYDVAEAEFLNATAAISVAEANLEQAKAQVEIAKANLTKAERNLSYCVISSPVDGVIIDRRVSIGQTVVSNQTASSIFLIAKDLKKMQVWVSVNEADIGNIKVGMPVIFNVDAFPEIEFEGKVHRIRLNATLSSNVVTYVVEVSTDNSNGKLLPYLTANVKFVRAKDMNALVVSNAALRYQPSLEAVDAKYHNLIKDRKTRRIWVPDGDSKVKPIAVTVGVSNGVSTSVKAPELKEGMMVVSGETRVDASTIKDPKANKSPFMPTPPKRRRNSAKEAGPGAGPAGAKARVAVGAR